MGYVLRRVMAGPVWLRGFVRQRDKDGNMIQLATHHIMESKELNKIKDNKTSKVKENEGRETMIHAVLAETINKK